MDIWRVCLQSADTSPQSQPSGLWPLLFLHPANQSFRECHPAPEPQELHRAHLCPSCLLLLWERNILCSLALGNRCPSLRCSARSVQVAKTISHVQAFFPRLLPLYHLLLNPCANLGCLSLGKSCVVRFCFCCQIMLYSAPTI